MTKAGNFFRTVFWMCIAFIAGYSCYSILKDACKESEGKGDSKATEDPDSKDIEGMEDLEDTEDIEDEYAADEENTEEIEKEDGIEEFE